MDSSSVYLRVLCVKFEFGVPLEDICCEGKIHYKLNSLLADAITAKKRSRERPEKFLRSNDHNVEECRDLKEALLSSFDLIKLYDPKTYCHVIREFLNQLPISLFPICHSEYQFRWMELTQSCRNMITRRSHNKYDKFDRLIAERVSLLPLAHFAFLHVFMEFILSYCKDSENFITSMSVRSVVSYFTPSIFHIQEPSDIKMYFKLIKYLIVRWNHMKKYLCHDRVTEDNQDQCGQIRQQRQCLTTKIIPIYQTVLHYTDNNNYLKDVACQTESETCSRQDNYCQYDWKYLDTITEVSSCSKFLTEISSKNSNNNIDDKTTTSELELVFEGQDQEDISIFEEIPGIKELSDATDQNDSKYNWDVDLKAEETRSYKSISKEITNIIIPKMEVLPEVKDMYESTENECVCSKTEENSGKKELRQDILKKTFKGDRRKIELFETSIKNISKSRKQKVPEYNWNASPEQDEALEKKGDSSYQEPATAECGWVASPKLSDGYMYDDYDTFKNESFNQISEDKTEVENDDSTKELISKMQKIGWTYTPPNFDTTKHNDSNTSATSKEFNGDNYSKECIVHKDEEDKSSTKSLKSFMSAKKVTMTNMFKRIKDSSNLSNYTTKIKYKRLSVCGSTLL